MQLWLPHKMIQSTHGIFANLNKLIKALNFHMTKKQETQNKKNNIYLEK